MVKNHFWYAIKKVASPDKPKIGIAFNRKWVQHTTILPPETPPEVVTSAFNTALCFIDTKRPICIPNPVAKGTIKYHNSLKCF